jgi:predicted ATPase/class 3 adenylate cyclase
MMTPVRGDLPFGTVTFLFTDVEGSTKLLHELGAEGYDQALIEHRRVLREAFVRHGGVEVDTQGDAFFYAFPTAEGALHAAGEGTAALEEGPIAVRLGLHTGTPHIGKEGYIGDDVHLAARIAASAHGGQVILSAATAELVELELTDLGEHRLKDIAQAVLIYQLGTGSFPPLKTISNTNLPRPASSFLGREIELREVISKIEAGARLVTLTGPGGTGKTRLAIEAAASLVPERNAGVFWVGLATVRDPALVTETIAQTLGAKDSLADHIGEREMLLLLDNLEHVIDWVPELAELLAACPNLMVLVTSRELLRVQGEVEFAVPPLAEPDAIELFCARAGLDPSDEISELCRRLDSLPLAVELAAARTKALSPAQVLERLSQRLDLLKGGRDRDPRQQTLRATIEWSYERLSPEEQQAFARLSVFAGGCTLEAADQVAEADLDMLQSLVEKSLLRFSDERYSMLETIREYADERLAAHGRRDAIARRHVEFFIRFAERMQSEVDRTETDTRVAADKANFRAALAFCGGGREPELMLRLAGRVWPLWVHRGHASESARWLEEAIGNTDVGAPEDRARVLRGLGAVTRGDPAKARAFKEEALEMYRSLENNEGIASCLTGLGMTAIEERDYDRAEALFTQSLALRTHVVALHGLAQVALNRGDLKRARELYEDMLVEARTRRNESAVARILTELAWIAAVEGRLDDVARLAGESLPGLLRAGASSSVADCVLLAALVLAFRGDASGAARLVGAAEERRQQLGWPPLNPVLAGLFTPLEHELGEERFAAECAAGAAAPFEAAVGLAGRTLD